MQFMPPLPLVMRGANRERLVRVCVGAVWTAGRCNRFWFTGAFATVGLLQVASSRWLRDWPKSWRDCKNTERPCSLFLASVTNRVIKQPLVRVMQAEWGLNLRPMWCTRITRHRQHSKQANITWYVITERWATRINHPISVCFFSSVFICGF